MTAAPQWPEGGVREQTGHDLRCKCQRCLLADNPCSHARGLIEYGSGQLLCLECGPLEPEATP